METKRALLGSQTNKRHHNRTVHGVIKKRNKLYQAQLYKAWKEANYPARLYPWTQLSRVASMSEEARTEEWEETRKEVILASDWGEWYTLCLQQLGEDDVKRRDNAITR